MLRPVHDVENVVDDPAFWVAFVIGAAGVALVWLRLRRGRREPGVAIAVTVACVVGLRVDHRLPAALVVALVLLVLGEWLTRDLGLLARGVAAVPGALVLGASLPDGWPFWIRAVVVVAGLSGGALADGADRAAPRVVPALLAIGSIGVYLCVPDTEVAKALLGALVAGALIGVEPRLTPTRGVAMLGALFVWIAGYGGVGRPGAVVGSVACLGVALLAPVVRWRATSAGRMAILIVAQCALVAYESRVAGFEHSAWRALALSLPAFVVAGAVLAVAGHERGVAASAP
jgi:hypothetical protein